MKGRFPRSIDADGPLHTGLVKFPRIRLSSLRQRGTAPVAYRLLHAGLAQLSGYRLGPPADAFRVKKPTYSEKAARAERH